MTADSLYAFTPQGITILVWALAKLDFSHRAQPGLGPAPPTPTHSSWVARQGLTTVMNTNRSGLVTVAASAASVTL